MAVSGRPAEVPTVRDVQEQFSGELMKLQTFQIGMNTSDLAGSIRLYSEAFGFVNAGGQVLWGELIRVQGLEPSARALMWWLMGRQKFFQLELFQHTQPVPRPLRADWRPCDHGWVRLGFAVRDFGRALAALQANGVSLLAPPMTANGLRRAAFRDPYIGVIVEVMEDGKGLTGYEHTWSGDGPAVVYATSSVSDIESARTHYRDTLGFELEPIELLHAPAHEALWGLSGARREGFLVRTGDTRLEIVEYHDPVGRPRPADYRTSDQGIVNAALGTRDVATVAAAFERLAAVGLEPPHTVTGPDVLGGYIIAPERELEIVALPESMDAVLGLVPSVPFLSAQL
jgi:catechol 2,3-dioxygenase-like lactoylglutathione lyase family enzyme